MGNKRADIIKRILVLIMAVTISVPGTLGAHFGIAYAGADDTTESVQTEAPPDEAAKEDESTKQETSASYPAFDMTDKADDITVHVTAPKDTFPEGSKLFVEKVSSSEQKQVDKAVDSERPDDTNVVLSYTFDIKVVDSDGNEIQPADGKKVSVSFTSDEVSNDNLDTDVYHITKEGNALSAESLEVTTDEDTATVVTDGFSYYTVEFTYGDLTYVMDGDTAVPLTEIMDCVGLAGTVTDVETSDPDLFFAYRAEDGAWYIFANQPFDTDEWMKLTIDGLEFKVEFLVTDAITNPQGDWAKDLDIASFTIDYDRIRNGDTRDILLTLPDGSDIKTTKVDGGFYRSTESSSRNNASFTAGSGNYVVYNPTGGTVNYRDTISLPGVNFRMTYKNAASDSAAKYTSGTGVNTRRPAYDVVVEVSDLKFHTSRASTSGTYSEEFQIAIRWYATDDGYRNFTPGLVTKSKAQKHVGIEATIKVYIIPRGAARNSSSAIQGGTFIYTTNGLNLNRYSTGFRTTGDGQTAWAQYYWFSEGAYITDPVNGIFVKSSDTPFQSDGWFIAKGASSSSTTNESGYAGLAAVGGTDGITTNFLLDAPASALISDVELLADGITHTVTSSSGRYGKIETTSDGNPNGDLSTGTILYGGRYVADNQGNVITEQKRTYDVPDGKEVTYTMTPEPGFIIDKLYIATDNTSSPSKDYDGSLLGANPKKDGRYTEVSPTDSNFKAVYKADGSIDYYTYTFPDTGTYPNQHIHVTWQPATSIEVEKKWEDIDDFYGVRPDEIYIDLLQDDVSYKTLEDTKLFYTTNAANPTTAQEPSTVLVEQPDTSTYPWKGTWSHTYKNIPLYANYDEVTNSGDEYQYTVKETIRDATAQKYYTEVTPHAVQRTKTKVSPVNYYADGSDFNHTYRIATSNSGGAGVTEYMFNESSEGWVTDGYYETGLNYEITNKLNYSDLYIEKEVIAGSDKGEFAFDVTLENGDVTSDPLTTSNSGKGPSVSYVVGNVAGDSLFSQSTEKEAALQVLEGTSYSVTEKYQDGWMQTARSPQAAKGTILNTSDVYGFKVVSGASGADTVYVYKNGKLYTRDGKTEVNLGDLPSAQESGLIKNGKGEAVNIRYFDYQGVEVYKDANDNYSYEDGTPYSDVRYFDVSGNNIYPYTKQDGSQVYIYADGSEYSGPTFTWYADQMIGRRVRLYDNTGRLVASDGSGGYYYTDEAGNNLGAVPYDEVSIDVYDIEGNKVKSNGNGGYVYDGGANDGQDVVVKVYDEYGADVTNSLPLTPKIYDEKGNEIASPPTDKPYYDENGSEVTTGGSTGYVHVLDGTEVVAHIFDKYGDEIFPNGNGGYEYADGTQAPKLFDSYATQVYGDGIGNYYYGDGTKAVTTSTTTTLYDEAGYVFTSAVPTRTIDKKRVVEVVYGTQGLWPIIQGNSIVYKGYASDGSAVSDVVYAKGIHRAWFENVKTMDLTVYKQWLDDKTDSHTAAELIEAFRIYKRDFTAGDTDEAAEDVTSLYANGGTSNTYPDITHYSNDSVNKQDYITVTQDSVDSTLWKYELKGIPAYYRDPADDNISTQDHALAYFIKEDKYSFDKNDDYLTVKYATDKNDLSSGANYYDPTAIRTGDYTETANDPDVKYIINRKKVDLTIGKEVTGNQGSRDKYFKISITLKGPDTGEEATLDTSKLDTVTSSNSATSYSTGAMNTANNKDENTSKNGQQITFTANTEKKFDIYLQHGESITIKDLPAGVKYKIEETKDSYKPSTYITSGDTLNGGPDSTTKVTVGSGNDTIEDTAMISDTVLKFTNDSKAAIPTEVRTPWLLGILFIMLAAAVISAYLIYQKRHQSDDDFGELAYVPRH